MKNIFGLLVEAAQVILKQKHVIVQKGSNKEPNTYL